MDLPSPGSPDKLSILGRNDSSLHKEKDDPSHTSEINERQELMVQRCVIIQKDEKGYGLTVSGDNPVFVQSVKEDGAAARAGVQQGDRIIKVNSTLVTQSNHQEVVELIKYGSYVALTLLGKPQAHNKGSLSPQQSFSIVGSNVNINNNSNKPPSSDMITAPQPVDPEKQQQQLTNSRIHTIRKMLEKEVMYLETLQIEFSKSPSEKVHSEVLGAMKRVKTLEDELFTLTGVPHEHVPEKQQQLTNSRIHIIRKMLEKEVMYLETLRIEFSKSPSERVHSEFLGAMKRVKTLEDQLFTLTGFLMNTWHQFYTLKFESKLSIFKEAVNDMANCTSGRGL